MDLTPITLEGTHVRLEPLASAHVPALVRVGLDPTIWEWTGGTVSSAEEMATYVGNAISRHADGTALPFALVSRSDGCVVGSTRFGNVDHGNRRVEIGWTWVAPAWQRTGINTEAKLLLLTHAFEQLGCVRVELKTDVLNRRSRAAILRLGAQEEGVLRQHMVVAGGRLRNTVYFSILDHEWPTVRERLESLLRR